MRTDELISVMTADHRRVDAAWLHRATAIAGVLALAITVLLVLVTLGPRRDLASAWITLPVITKLLLGASLTLIALVVFQRSLRPGLQPGRTIWLAALPIAAVGGWALLTLAQAPPESWSGLTFGRNWRTCLIAVPLYALVPCLLLLGLARHGAPIDMRLTGACAGIASAGLAIVGYGLHCPDDAAPFLATWYAIAVAIIAALSAIAAPRLLRW